MAAAPGSHWAVSENTSRNNESESTKFEDQKRAQSSSHGSAHEANRRSVLAPADSTAEQKDSTKEQTRRDGSRKHWPRMKDLPPALGERSKRAPHAIIARRRSPLGPDERAVFGAICDYGNPNPVMWPSWVDNSTVQQHIQSHFDGENEQIIPCLAWPSISKLCEHTALSERAVQVALRNLETARALDCVYRSKGGAPRKPRSGENARPGRANCYLITPHCVHRSKPESDNATRNAAPSADKPRTEFDATPHPAVTNPAPRAPNNPAPCAPEVSNAEVSKGRERYNAKATSSTRARERLDDAACMCKDVPEDIRPADIAAYTDQIERFLKSRQCVEKCFGAVDKKVSTLLFGQRVTIQQIEHAVLLTCARWYTSFLNGNKLARIKSLSYFENTITEVGQTEVSKHYWHYIQQRVTKLERQWLQTQTTTSTPKRGAVSSAGNTQVCVANTA